MGTAYGPKQVTSGFVSQYVAQPMTFNGTSDYIQCNLAGTFSEITFDFWSYFDDASLDTKSRNESIFGDWTSTRVHFGSRWSVGMHWNVNNAWTEIPTTNLRYGWNHYALTWSTSANQKLVYINKTLSSSSTTNGSITIGDMKIGKATVLDQYYRGQLFTFKVYNKALNNSEIVQNFSAFRSKFGI
jgi:hypothetical protein